MSAWNVFKMELYKNLHDRVSLVMMLILMSVNIIGGLSLSNQHFGVMIAMLFSFSVMGSAVFLFIYPYQMARTDYKNKVMSLLIASGVSRVQYYFVKVGATLIFSFLSFLMLVFLPLLIVLASHDMALALEILGFPLEIDASVLAIGFLGWLSIFFMLMTSVIIAKGRGITIFVFMGISFVVAQFSVGFHRTFGGSMWQTNLTLMAFQYLLIIVAMGGIGILILRRQDL